MSQQKIAKQFRKLFKQDLRDQYSLLKEAIRPKAWYVPTFIYKFLWWVLIKDLKFPKKTNQEKESEEIKQLIQKTPK